LEFRHASLTDFLNDLVNGKGGIREATPRARVCLWTLALSEPNGLQRVREDSGEDAAELARVVRPDLHCFQTHWPDWVIADLPPNYVDAYRPFLAAVRAAAPKLPLMIQADTGSQPQNRRSWDWIRGFERACARLGVGSTTFYEYFIGLSMYTDAPRIAEVRAHKASVELRFTKRLDTASARDRARYHLDKGRITAVRVDGSNVHLTVEGVRPGDHCTLTVRDIADDTRVRLFRDHPPAVLTSQTVRFRR
ncbi:MAG TPA: hypothetical protein VFB21_03250, partial [Chthonomonadaceae bacterium]|nr:hypothetical protein [Chthonomonadaceae bacterium]